MKKKITMFALLFCIYQSSTPSSTIVHGESNSEFTDAVGHWAEQTIRWGAENELIDGFPDHTFRPDAWITESEFTAVLLRSFQMKADSDTGRWSDAYYEIGIQKNIPLLGIEREEKRDMPINRTSVAQIIAGVDGKHYVGADAIRYILQKGYAQGKVAPEHSGITVYSYRGEDFLTRAEALQFIKKIREQGLKEIAKRPEQVSDPAPLMPLPGEKLKGVRILKSGPILFSGYEVERGTVYFTNSDVSPDNPAYRISLRKKFNPLLNEHIYAIANSLYDPEKEKLTMWYSRKGSPTVSIHFGTFDTSLQSQNSPYFNKPFEYELYEEHLSSKSEAISLRIHRLWGNENNAPEMDDYYVQKLRSSLISFLGENDGISVGDALVEEMKELIQEQAKVNEWNLRIGSPELNYRRSQTMSLPQMDVSIFTSITGIQVAFTSKTDRDAEADHYAVTPDGTYIIENKQAVVYNNVLAYVRKQIVPKGMVVVRASDDFDVSEDEISTPYGTAKLIESSFTYADDPDRIPQTAYEVVVDRADPDRPTTTIRYILSGTVIGDKESAKQDMLELSRGWVIPVEPK